jgi:hydrogenase expression/formation protein HypE
MSHSNSILSASCPMPKMDFDIITLGHGSGGLLTNKLLEAGVFDVLKNDLLDQKHDGVVLELNGKTAFSTDSFVVSPIFFPGGNIGELAINGTVNDIAMCGARAEYLSLAFVIEEGLLMSDFWEILLSIRQAADAAGVQIVTGDTKVVERGKGDQIFINTTGVGRVHPKADIAMGRVQAGDVLIVSGPIAAHGMAIMSVREGLEFESAIESDTCHFNHIVQQLLDEYGTSIHLLRDATRGGVATVLNEVARDTRLGMRIHENRLVVSEQVAAACELLGLDPLYVANEGVFIAFVAPDVAESLLTTLRGWERGRQAFIMGEVVEQHPKQVILKSSIGGQRVVNMLLGEQLPRIC